MQFNKGQQVKTCFGDVGFVLHFDGLMVEVVQYRDDGSARSLGAFHHTKVFAA